MRLIEYGLLVGTSIPYSINGMNSPYARRSRRDKSAVKKFSAANSNRKYQIIRRIIAGMFVTQTAVRAS